jgi:hypothetical protein
LETGVDLKVGQLADLRTPLGVLQFLKSTRAEKSGQASSAADTASIEFVETVRQRLANCIAETDFYEVLIGLERIATPTELEAISRAGRTRSHEFDAKLQALVRALGPELARFSRIQINPSVSLYSNGRGASTLIVGFTGRIDLLFMPIALVLQYFADDCDVLVLRDPGRTGFGNGIGGYATSFPEMVARLKQDIDFGRYKSVRCLGTSGGGCAALAGGILMGAERAVCFSGRLPSRARRETSRNIPPDIENAVRTAVGDPSRFFCVFGADNEKDVGNAQAIREVLDTTLIPVAGVADHNVVWHLHLRGEYLRILKRTGLVA